MGYLYSFTDGARDKEVAVRAAGAGGVPSILDSVEESPGRGTGDVTNDATPVLRVGVCIVGVCIVFCGTKEETPSGLPSLE